MIKTTIQNGSKSTKIQFPCSETEMSERLGELGMNTEHLAPVGTVTEIEPSELSAVISTSTANYANIYDGIREGYSGGYTFSGSTWKSSVSAGDIYGRLDQLLGLTAQSGKHSKIGADGIEYSVYGLSVNVDNAPFAPGPGDISQFSATSDITLEVPLSFCGDVLPPMKINLSVKSKYTPKF